MKQYISESYFVDQIVGDEYNSMSSEGGNALFHYLEQHEDECSFEIEFDRVAIRCEWTEYTNIEEVLKEYDNIKLDINYDMFKQDINYDMLEKYKTKYLTNK